MKVLLINGSSRNNGCTGAALQEVERSLQEEGIETERFFIGNAALPDCIACRRCKETGRCVYHDIVNEFVEKAEKADGFVFGSPVYFAHPSGRLMTFMDRAFYSGGTAFQYKPAAAVLSARRSGARQPHLMSSINTLQSVPCQWFLRLTGIMSTERSRSRSPRTERG